MRVTMALGEREPGLASSHPSAGRSPRKAPSAEEKRIHLKLTQALCD
jgi:hypothetical protein